MTETVIGHSGELPGFEVTLGDPGPKADLFCDTSLLRKLSRKPEHCKSFLWESSLIRSSNLVANETNIRNTNCAGVVTGTIY
jgi:hypothetical protein